MDLHIVQMFQTYPVFFGNTQGVPCKMRIIGRVLIQPANAAACKDRIRRIDLQYISLSVLRNDPRTLHTVFSRLHIRFFYNDIRHSSVLHDTNIFKRTHLCEQLTRNLFSGHILMEQDTRSGVGALSGKCIIIQKVYLPFRLLFIRLFRFFLSLRRILFRAAVFPLKLHAISDQLPDNFPGAADHNVHRLFSVLIMPCPHRIFKIALIVRLIFEHTDSALGKERIATLGIFLCNNKDFPVPGQIQGSKKTCRTGSHDHYILLHFSLSFHFLIPLTVHFISLLSSC